MLPLYRTCIAAMGDTGYQAILSVGNRVDLSAFGELPENVEIYPSVDQIAVLQKADAFLTHCGMNSVSEALYFGVPLLMLPKTKEQEGVAERVRQLGAGLLLEGDSPEEIRLALQTLMKDHTYRKNAESIAESFRGCGGAKAAADKIESCSRTTSVHEFWQ